MFVIDYFDIEVEEVDRFIMFNFKSESNGRFEVINMVKKVLELSGGASPATKDVIHVPVQLENIFSEGVL